MGQGTERKGGGKPQKKGLKVGRGMREHSVEGEEGGSDCWVQSLCWMTLGRRLGLCTKCLDQGMAHEEGSAMSAVTRQSQAGTALSSTLWDMGLLLVIQQGRARAEVWRRNGGSRPRWEGVQALNQRAGSGEGAAAWHPLWPTSSLARRPHKRLHQGAPELPTGQQTAVANIYRLHQAWLEPVSCGEREGWPFCSAVGRTVRPAELLGGQVLLRSRPLPSQCQAVPRRGGTRQAQVSPERRGSMITSV